MKKFALGILAVSFLSLGAVVACDGDHSSSAVAWDFTISLSNGSNVMNKGEEAHINIDEIGGNPEDAREFTYTCLDSKVASVNANGTVTALEKGKTVIAVKEGKSEITRSLELTVIDASPADGGFNYASASGKTAIEKRTEILGALEKNAMDNHLTGITLFDNGGYVKYRSRVNLPTTTYITGYGFGLLSEGSLKEPLAAETASAYKMYLHTASSSDPLLINARDNDGSQVSDLEGYITSSYWSTKMNDTKDGYVWYPVLAKDTVKFNGVSQANDRPIPVYKGQEVKPDEEPNPLGLYSTWRIYVKTGEDGFKYRYSGSPWDGVDYDHRPVAIEDYEFAFRNLLTGSHGLTRGSQIAYDQTYGIVGAQRYYNNTNIKDMTDEKALNVWNNMKSKGELGLVTGHDETNGDFIQLTLLNPIDRFTAMYTLSSNLYSPIPESFIRALGYKAGTPEDKIGFIRDGSKKYGTFNDNDSVPQAHQNKICDSVLSVGPYMLESWEKRAQILFKRNTEWNEPGRYNIEGVKVLILEAAKSSPTAIYDRFKQVGDLDSCGIPSQYIDVEVGQPDVFQTKGNSTFKLNVNSCTQEMWDTLNKKLWKHTDSDKYICKPWMSNDNFLNGLFYSIDRKTFATKQGSQPSINYFSDSYLSDPENGISYNDTKAHKDAVAAYQTYDTDGNPTYGYSKDRAVSCFKAAVRELVAQGKLKYGSVEKPNKISINIWWMYQSDVKQYGEDIEKYFTDAFNDPDVSGGTIKLEIEQNFVTVWDKVYSDHLQVGKFDLGFGAISGNTYNPLNFLEVLKSDNSSTFTLNWGTDTSVISKTKPLIYDDKMWSFDALWSVADHGGIVKNGSVAKTVEISYLDANKNDFYNGLTFSVATKFIEADAAEIDLTRVQIYVVGFGGVDVEFEKSVNEKGELVATIHLSQELAAQINADMRHANHMDDKDKYPKLWNETPFTQANYNKYWNIDVFYSLAITSDGQQGTPTEAYVTAAKNAGDWIEK